MASRHCGLKFGRLLFEFGISGSAGSDHGSREPPFPIWRGTTALLKRYYHSSGTAAVCHGTTARMVLPLFGRGTTAGCPVPSFSYQALILVVLFGGLCSFFHSVSFARVFASR